jgi:hypothetical protein
LWSQQIQVCQYPLEAAPLDSFAIEHTIASDPFSFSFYELTESELLRTLPTGDKQIDRYTEPAFSDDTYTDTVTMISWADSKFEYRKNGNMGIISFAQIQDSRFGLKNGIRIGDDLQQVQQKLGIRSFLPPQTRVVTIYHGDATNYLYLEIFEGVVKRIYFFPYLG